jgi:hypothetical protein
MIVPSGKPVWGGTTSMLDYGGHLEKKNYGGIGMVNALTDTGAEQFVRMTTDAASVARTAGQMKAQLNISRDGTTITVNKCITPWTDSSIGSYDGANPPTGYPEVTLSGTNTITVSIATSATDEFGVSENIVLHGVFVGGPVKWDGTFTGNTFDLLDFIDTTSVSIMVW